MFMVIKDLCKSYQAGEIETVALRNASITLNKGDIGVILGPSGSGKSTLMNIIGGIDTADRGSVIVDNQEITKFDDNRLTEYRREKIGFVFQSYNLIPHLTVSENIEVIESISKDPLPLSDVLAAVGLTDKKNRFPRELSGGEQQRVAIARAVIKNPHLLLCDEITGALDYASAIDALDLIQEVSNRFGTTVLIITHNTAISKIANRVYKLRSGEVVDCIVNENPSDARKVEW